MKQLWLSYVQSTKSDATASSSADMTGGDSFHDTMPGFHFLPSKQTFSYPRPLLLAAMLYSSSHRGPAEMAALAPEYLTVLHTSISQLCVPGSGIRLNSESLTEAAEWAFQTVLGILLASLLREAIDRETGFWLSLAYRLVLEHCPQQFDDRSHEWRRLFSGLQVWFLPPSSR